jgi:uncharacterized membrane protein
VPLSPARTGVSTLVTASIDMTPPASAQEEVARNVRRIAQLVDERRRQLSWSDRVSLRAISVAGTVWFVLAHVAAFAAWAAWNSLGPVGWRVDPYPFGLLTMAVSLEGVLLAAFVLVTQRRLSIDVDRRDHLHLQVAILAERESTLILQTVRGLAERLGIEAPASAEPLAVDTDLRALLREIERQFPGE